MTDDKVSATISLGEETYQISQKAVIEAFRQTNPPYDSHTKRVYVNGEGKGVKDVFRNIGQIPDDASIHTHYLENLFEEVGFEIGDADDEPNSSNDSWADSIRAWHFGFNSDTWWRQFRQSGSVSLGFSDTNTDYTEFEGNTLQEIITELGIDNERDHPGNPAKQVWRFANKVNIGDIVCAKDGRRSKPDDEWTGNGRILAIGVVKGEYQFKDANDWYEDLPDECQNTLNNHHRTVDWIVDLENTEHGPFQPDAQIQRWTIDDIDYPQIKNQILESHPLKDDFEQLETRSQELASEAKTGATNPPTVWIEKSVHSSDYKQTEGWKLGQVIWCPQTMTDETQSVHYENIKDVETGDVVLHLNQEDREFTSASIAADTYEEITCPAGSQWDRDGIDEMGFERGERPAYQVQLRDHTEFEEPLDVEDVLNRSNSETLHEIREEENVVFNRKLGLNQGSYLTKAPNKFVELIYSSLEREVGHGIPHLDTFETSKIQGQQMQHSPSTAEYWQDVAAKRRKAEIFLSNPTQENFEDWLADFSWYVSRYRETTAADLFSETSPEDVAKTLEEAAESGEIDAVLDLPGFGISAASEALTVLAPEEFAILNKDAADSLEALRFDQPNPNTNSPVRYKEYLEDVAEIIEQYPLREHVDDVPSWATDLQVANYAFYLHGNGDLNLGELPPEDPLSELTELIEEESQEHLYRQAAAHLVAGKNIVFYGPPGTGKTRAADLLTDALCTSTSLVTANAEWSNYQVVGGYRPDGESWESEPGFLTESADRCTETLRRESSRPSWLIIDELNRANLDEAFGDVFTLLDLDYRTTQPLSYANTDVYMPLSFRILATMNTYDQAQLFSLGYAFRRRFAFVSVPSLLEEQVAPSEVTEMTVPSESPTVDAAGEELVDLIEDAAVDSMSIGADGEGVTESDVAPIFPEFANGETLEEALSAIQEDESMQTDGLTATETLVYLCLEITNSDVIDIGQALLIDATKYLIAHQLLFPKETDRSTLDDAVVAYIVPQFEHFMSELRRAETINQDSDAEARFDRIIQLASDLSLPQTASVLAEAKKTKRLLS